MSVNLFKLGANGIFTPSSCLIYTVLETSAPHTSLSNDETSVDPSHVEDEILIFISAGSELSGWWWEFFASSLSMNDCMYIEEKQIFELSFRVSVG